jgi:hypothetical protein
MHDALTGLATAERKPMQEILKKAIEAYRRARMLEAGNEADAALKKNPKKICLIHSRWGLLLQSILFITSGLPKITGQS